MGTPVEAQLTLSDNNSNQSHILKEYPTLRWCIFGPSLHWSASKWTSKLNHFVQGHPGLSKAHTKPTRYRVSCDFINKLQTSRSTNGIVANVLSAMIKCKPLSFHIKCRRSCLWVVLSWNTLKFNDLWIDFEKNQKYAWYRILTFICKARIIKCTKCISSQDKVIISDLYTIWNGEAQRNSSNMWTGPSVSFM